MSHTVKCSTCNIVINEVLAFISNKIDIMDEVSISRICATAFSESDIVQAKRLLFESLSATNTMKTRKRDGKTIRDIDDIICRLKETDPEKLPVFVARELQKLPPVLFDHLDATRLLKDLLKLRNEINQFPEEYATRQELSLLKSELENLKKASLVNNFNLNVNNKRGACLIDSFEYDSGPMGLPPVCPESEMSPKLPQRSSLHVSGTDRISSEGTSENKSESQQTHVQTQGTTVGSPTNATASAVRLSENKSVACDKAAPMQSTMSHSTPTSRAPAGAAAAAAIVPAKETVPRHTAAANAQELSPSIKKQKQYSDAAQGGEWKIPPPSEEWILIQKKRLRNRFIGQRGSAMVDSDSKFRAAEIKVPVYIYNVAKETTMCDISNYIMSKTNISTRLEKMNMRTTKDYDAYKVYVPKHKIEIFLKDDFWPDGIAFRRFVDFSWKKKEGVNTPPMDKQKTNQ